MYSIVKLESGQSLDLARICLNAYPGVTLTPEKYAEGINIQNSYDFINFYFIEERLFKYFK